MAEGVLGGLLGGDEGAEREGDGEDRVVAEAFAAALAQDHAKYDPAVARAAERFLDKQARLLDVQTEGIIEERPLRLRLLQNQTREGRSRRFGLSIRNGLQAITAVVVGLIGLGLVVMVVDAFTSRSVVVDAFKAPSALAGRGLTGDVVASGVLDELQRLQDATRLATKALPTRTAWSSDVKIEVPQTGVSIGEINRLLHVRFGHDVHIDGDLVQAAEDGLALTVRGDGIPSKTFTGGAGDLGKLTVQAAEYAYGRSQPIDYVQYLSGVGRFADALAFLPGAYVRAPQSDRADLANVWGNAYAEENKSAQAEEKYRLAISLKPYNWKSWGNLVGSVAIGHGEEAGWRESQAMLRAVEQAPKKDRPSKRFLLNGATISQDWPLQLAASLEDAKHNQGAGAMNTIEGPTIADDYIHLHDPARASHYLALSDPDDSTTKAETLLAAGYAALDRGDPAAAVQPLEAFWKAWLADSNLQYTYNEPPCTMGLAYGLAGRMAEAEAVFKRVGPTAYCYAVHGDVLEHAGDLAGAERIWTEGLRLGPDLSPVLLHRGRSELARGDLKRAEADLAAASARSPHWADPLKDWGDVLARDLRWKDALAKYDLALKYAPAWTELHQARDAAARHPS